MQASILRLVGSSNTWRRSLLDHSLFWHVFRDMVAQKRIDYGFVGYQVPTKPRAARSTRVNKFCFSYGADYLLPIYFRDYQNIPCKYFVFNDVS